MSSGKNDANEASTEGQKLLKELQIQQTKDASSAATIVVLLVGAAVVLVYAREIGAVLSPSPSSLDSFSTFVRFVAVAMLIGMLGYITFLYASGSRLFRIRAMRAPGVAIEAVDAQTLATVIDTVTRAANDIKDSRFVTQADRSIISEQLAEIVRDSLPSDFLTMIDDRYGAAIRNEKLSIYVEAFLEITKTRLSRFQESLSLKAATSLAWGVSIATLGLLILGLFIYLPPEGNWNNVGVIFHVIARLGLVAIIEVVAFFFLSQYRFTLLDEKYVNNEITNAELRLLSLVAAAKLGITPALEKALAELSKTERNFALKKGEISVFHSGSGGDLLQNAVVADLLSRLVPAIPGYSASTKNSRAAKHKTE